jgi:hypothetical protein
VGVLCYSARSIQIWSFKCPTSVSRGKHLVNAGESVDLTVGGNQRLVTKESNKAAATAKADIPVGVDVSDEPIDGPMEGGPAESENGKEGLFGSWFSDSDIDAVPEATADADAGIPVQGDLFDDGKDFDPEG